MLDWSRSMLWLYDVISGGHLAVRLGQMTFKIHTVWPTSKHPTLDSALLSSSFCRYTGDFKRERVLNKIVNTFPVFQIICWPFYFWRAYNSDNTLPWLRGITWAFFTRIDITTLSIGNSIQLYHLIVHWQHVHTEIK